jgi:hypothetical protein
MNHQNGEILNQLSKTFSSTDGYRILSTVISDEYKLLQETKRILEKRLQLDEDYARNLQDLTASADRIAWPVNTHPIAAVNKNEQFFVKFSFFSQASREVFLQWSHLASEITKKTVEFRRNIIDDSLKELIEQKNDSKKYLDEEKRRYDLKHRTVSCSLARSDQFHLFKFYSERIFSLGKLHVILTHCRMGFVYALRQYTI